MPGSPRDGDLNESSAVSDLERLEAACATLKGGVQLCRHVIARLKALLEVLKSLETSERGPVVREFEAAGASLLLALESQSRDAFPLQWVATSQRSVARYYLVHKRIGMIYAAIGVSEATQLVDWRGKLSGDRLEHERWLEERLELSTDAMIYRNMPSQAKHREALMTLASQLQLWPTSQVGDDQVSGSTELKMSRKLAASMKQAADRVCCVFWYITYPVFFLRCKILDCTPASTRSKVDPYPFSILPFHETCRLDLSVTHQPVQSFH